MEVGLYKFHIEKENSILEKAKRSLKSKNKLTKENIKDIEDFQDIFISGINVSFEIKKNGNTKEKAYCIRPRVDNLLKKYSSKNYLIQFDILPMIKGIDLYKTEQLKKEIIKFIDHFQNMSQSKAFYILSRSILCSGILKNLNKNYKIAFNTGIISNLVYKSQKEIQSCVNSGAYNLQKYNYQDTHYSYKVIDYIDHLEKNFKK